MRPWNWKTENYGEYWRLKAGTYPIQVRFYEGDSNHDTSDKFPVLLDGEPVNKEQYINKVILPALKRFNRLNLDVRLELTDEESVNTISYYWKVRSHAYVHADRITVVMGLMPDVESEGCVNTVCHELLHCFKFNHKGGILTRNIPNMYWNQDDVHGLDIVYSYNSPYQLTGFTYNRFGYDEIEAYLVKWHKKPEKRKILYQSPVDAQGEWQFKLRKRVRKYKILLVAKKKDDSSIYFNTISHRPRKMGLFTKYYYEGYLEIDRRADSLHYISQETGIGLFYN